VGRNTTDYELGYAGGGEKVMGFDLILDPFIRENIEDRISCSVL
jgi:hypothetical protein